MEGPRLIVVSQQDNVGCALAAVAAGVELVAGEGDRAVRVVARQAIPFGHKVALRPIAAGEDVVRYGHPIGKATAPIVPGDHVHVHNLRSDRGR